MTGLNKQLTALELRLNRKHDTKTACALTLRAWWVYKNAERLTEKASDTTPDRAHLHKAQHTVQAALRKNESHIGLFMLAIFIAIQAGRYDNANEMLDKAMGFRSFLKSNEPFYYAVLRFLYALLEINQKRARSARKHIRSLEDFVSASPPNPDYELMLGMLSLAFFEYDSAYMYLEAAYQNGCRSMFLYQALYDYFRTGAKASDGETLLWVLGWAAAHRLDTDYIINAYPDALRTAILKNPAKGEAVYQNANHPFILREICAGRMMAADFGAQAYQYYREAERRQINLNGLYTFLIKAAYANNAKRIYHYAMAEFLQATQRQAAPMEDGLAIYVYHLLLTDPTLNDLVPEHKNNILRLATQCLGDDLTGREVNSLYAYYWEQCSLMGLVSPLLDKAEQILFEELTQFEVHVPPEVKYIYVNQPERKGMTVHECEDGIACIDAVSEEIYFTCLSAGRKSILQAQPVAHRMIAQAGFALYSHFFRNGATSFYLLAYLANQLLLRLDEITEDTESAAFDEAVRIFEALLAGTHCAKPYRMRLLAALGRLYYAAGHFAKALEQYSILDESELDDQFLEQILHVFLQTHEWGRAINLVARRGLRMERQALFDVINQLSGREMAGHHKALATVAYELLVNGCFSPELLTIVLDHFNGGREEWLALGHILHTMDINEPRLDEIILKNSLWCFKWDTDMQQAFVRLCGDGIPATGLLSRFVEFCTYEMLVNNTKPEYDTLAILEKAYLAHPSNHLLAWALGHVYIRHKVVSFDSDKIMREAIQSQEDASLLFPVFGESRLPSPSPYIEKNQPFMYKGLPNKDVWLYYRVDDGKTFLAKRMTYVRFGLYLTVLPVFYNESLTYYFSEEMPTGSITTQESQVKKTTVYLHESPTDDIFFTLNNAVIYEQMFKYEQVERIITALLKDVRPVRSGLL